MNLVGRDGENGPVLVSVKAETVAGQEHWRVLLRLRAGSTHDLVPAANLSSNPTPTKMVKVKAIVVHLKQRTLFQVSIASGDKNSNYNAFGTYKFAHIKLSRDLKRISIQYVRGFKFKLLLMI